MSFKVDSIGTVRNGITERPEFWKDIVSEIHIKRKWKEGLDGLEEFSHIVVIFYLHLSDAILLKVYPRNNTDLPLTGVFSTRAPVRPSHIAVSVVEVLGIHDTTLTVRGLDAFDGTPVLDIKPHLPVVSPTRLPSWV